MTENEEVEIDVETIDERDATNPEVEPTSQTERLQIRRGYRKLMQELREKREDLVKPGSGELLDHVKVANSLFNQMASFNNHEQVSYAREAAMDARFMAMSVSIADEKTSRIPTDLVQFRPEEFVEKLITKMDGRYIGNNTNEVLISGESWRNLGKHVSKFFNSTTPAISVLSGTFGVPVPPKPHTLVANQAHVIQKDGDKNDDKAKTQPIDVTETHKKNEEATTAEIERVYGIIRHIYNDDPTPIDYFELVVNPQSFGHTIENIFHVSFLIKDGLIRMYIDGNGLPVIAPVDQNIHDEGSQNDEIYRTYQGAISMSMDEWKEIVEVYELAGREPFIKPLKLLDQITDPETEGTS